MIGKVDPDALSQLVLDRTGASDPAVRQGPGYGEDAAAIDLGDEILVVSSDPLSLAAERLGTLAVHVAGNDVAACGADPRWLTSVLFLPSDDPDVLDTVTRQLDETASATGISIVGGHSEYAPSLDRPLLSLTCFGRTDRFLATGDAQAADRLVMTKAAGLEASAILATDFRDWLADQVDQTVLETAAGFFNELTVIPDARVLRDHATAMHDPTEGGLVDGLLEMAVASGLRAVVDREDVPVRPETIACCEAVGVDPLRTFGSGALVAAVPEDQVSDAMAELDASGIEGAVIGRLESTDDPALVLDDAVFAEPVRDDLYPLWE